MNSRTQVTVAPKGMGLNDFVAQQEGFFAAEGLEVSFDWKTFRGTQSSWKDLTYFERPQDKPYAEGRDVIQGACAWGSICNASAGMGRFVPQAYGNSPWAIFVRSNSRFRTPQDLKDVPIAVGHARRQPLQRALPAGEIPAAPEHQGREHRRLRGAAESIARRRSGSREPAAAADRHGRAAWSPQDDRGPLPYLVVGSGDGRARNRRRLSARTRSKKRWTPIWRNICRSGSSLCHRNSRTASGTTAASAAASASFISPLRAASSTKLWIRSSAGASTSISRSEGSRNWQPKSLSGAPPYRGGFQQ